MSLGICFKKLHLIKVGAFCFIQRQIRAFSVSGLKNENFIKKQTYMKTETCTLYSRVFWTLKPNFIKIDLYNFELYRFKVGAFFETVYVHCRLIHAVAKSALCQHHTAAVSHTPINVSLKQNHYQAII